MRRAPPAGLWQAGKPPRAGALYAERGGKGRSKLRDLVPRRAIPLGRARGLQAPSTGPDEQVRERAPRPACTRHRQRHGRTRGAKALRREATAALASSVTRHALRPGGGGRGKCVVQDTDARVRGRFAHASWQVGTLPLAHAGQVQVAGLRRKPEPALPSSQVKVCGVFALDLQSSTHSAQPSITLKVEKSAGPDEQPGRPLQHAGLQPLSGRQRTRSSQARGQGRGPLILYAAFLLPCEQLLRRLHKAGSGRHLLLHVRACLRASVYLNR